MSIFIDDKKLVTSDQLLDGRNFLKNTSADWISFQSSSYIIGWLDSDSLKSLQGLTCTIRVLIENHCSIPVRVQIWTNKGTLYGTFVNPNETNYSYVTGKIATGFTSQNIAIVTKNNSKADGNNSVRIKQAKLEIGNTPTPWSLAPEDTINKSDFDALKSQVLALQKQIGGVKRLLINILPFRKAVC